jgi:hypothetical protein
MGMTGVGAMATTGVMETVEIVEAAGIVLAVTAREPARKRVSRPH